MSPKALTQDEKDRLQAAKLYILTHLHEALPVQKISRIALMGEQKLRDGFKELFDLNIGPFIHEARMQYGLFLLRHTNKTIKEIAALTGYKRTHNFSREFKRFFGLTPNSVR